MRLAQPQVRVLKTRSCALRLHPCFSCVEGGILLLGFCAMCVVRFSMWCNMQTYGLTETSLRYLYHNQLLTQAEIAKRVGTSQSKISKLLAHWGIPRLVKSDRFKLPPLTGLQIEVLIGSLLGDGSMSATGKHTARVYEGHCPKQNGYTQWKADIMEPYTAKVFEADGLSFYTQGCRQLRPYFDLFYGSGVRVFPSNLHTILTPRALAIWYLDDGSILKQFHPRISFGLCAKSLRRALRALRALGFTPKAHPERGGNYAITFPGQNELFYEMITPFIPECMAYKIPDLTQRLKVFEDRHAAKLTSERAAELYLGNLPVVDIAKLYKVGASTVRRRLRDVGISPGVKKPRGILSLDAAEAHLGVYDSKSWANLSKDQQTQWIDEIEEVLHKCPFPVRSRTPQEAQVDFDKLVSLDAHLDAEDTISPKTWRGTTLCAEFFPNRYKASWLGSKTAYEAWHSKKDRRKAIQVQLRGGDPVLPHRILRAVTMQCRTPTVFKPLVAKYMYQAYASPGGRVWDPCAGYGGRLLGALAAGVRYVGTDVEPETVEGNRMLAAVLGKSDQVDVVLERAEVFDPGPVDMVFTSPPYFNIERYSQSAQQSFQRYGTFDEWIGGFLLPIMETSHRRLGVGQVMSFNLTDIKTRKKVLPLVARTIALAESVGFKLERTLWMPISSLNRSGRAGEPVLVFRKIGH